MTEAGNSRAIAVVGLGGRFPGAPDVASFWESLLAGHDLLWRSGEPAATGSTHYVAAGGALADHDEFDAELFGFTAREAELTDPQHRILLECVWEALEDAGHDPRQVDGRIG